MQYRPRAPLWLSALATVAADGGARRGSGDVFEMQKCAATIDEVNKTGSYSEESITPVCDKHMAWKECDFFAEALSLASSHQDFNKTHFCENMEEAHFCSGTMNKLLSSVPVSDLAFGECIRAEPRRSEEYCKKFQKMLPYAVQEEYLDTIRACYMIESYGNMTTDRKDKEALEASPAPAVSTPPPQGRIIVSASKELDRAGKGKANPGNSPPQVAGFGREGIVVKPAPLTDIGDGKGNMRGKPVAAPSPAAAQSSAPVAATETQAEPQGNIIVEPVPAKDGGAKQALVAKSVAAPAAPAAKAVAAHTAALRSKAAQAVAKAATAPQTAAKAAQPAAPKANATAVRAHVAALAAHPSKVVPAAKDKKKDAKDGYGGFMSSFVSL